MYCCLCWMPCWKILGVGTVRFWGLGGEGRIGLWLWWLVNASRARWFSDRRLIGSGWEGGGLNEWVPLLICD